MKVLLSTIGSRGDVQPLLALALELRALGHEAIFCVAPNFQVWVESLGFTCFPIGPDLKSMMSTGSDGADKPARPSIKRMRELAASTVREQFRVVGEAAHGCQLIVAATGIQIATRSIAEKMGIPYVFVGYCPEVFPALDHPPPPPPKAGFQYAEWLPSFVNRFLWMVDQKLFDVAFRSVLNEERGKLGLSPIAHVQRHVFTEGPWLAADPALAPASARSTLQLYQAGAWFLPDQSELPEELERFLAAGEPPVYFGFGSMKASAQMGNVLVDAARAAGLRAILSQGWGNLRGSDAGTDSTSIGDVNHAKLFARVAAIVHHGGAGTSTAAARAGKPQVIVPHIYDQYYFARRVQALGVGVSCSHSESFTTEELASALRSVSQPDIKSRAASLASRVVQDGARRAAQHLINQFSAPDPGAPQRHLSDHSETLAGK